MQNSGRAAISRELVLSLMGLLISHELYPNRQVVADPSLIILSGKAAEGRIPRVSYFLFQKEPGGKDLCPGR
jgi:hypothetical protein